MLATLDHADARRMPEEVCVPAHPVVLGLDDQVATVLAEAHTKHKQSLGEHGVGRSGREL